MKAQIVIPSYKRVDILKNKTLAMLRSYNVPDNKCKIYVATDEQLTEYQNEIKGEYDWQVIGRPGIGYLRNYISQNNKANEWLLWIDDDIEEVLYLQDNKLERIPDLNVMIDQMIVDADALGSGQVGIYPVNNHFFMKPKITIDLRFIIGCFCLTKNDPECEERTFDLVEDFERTLKYYLKYNKSMRYENITVKTNYMLPVGGIHETGIRTNSLKEAEVDRFIELFSAWCTKKYKANNQVDIKFLTKPQEVVFNYKEWLDQLNIQKH
tara:strand:+ start:5699 stop:6499 length:801 start_codon:yes stop_codon:yes gene_type:complete